MVKIAVAVKHVPEQGKVRVSKRTGKVVYDLEEGRMNPLGKKALEAALKLKTQDPNSEVLAISIGPEEAEPTLREALAMGADQAILVTDPLVVESDSMGIARTLASTIRAVGDVDVVMAGARTTDRYAGHVGPATAALLGWNIATHGQKVDYEDGQVRFEKLLADGRVATLRVDLPCLLSISEAAPKARHATSWGVHAAYTTGTYEAWTLDDLDLGEDQVGPGATVSSIQKVDNVPDRERDTEVFEDQPEEMAESLIRRLASRGLLR